MPLLMTCFSWVLVSLVCFVCYVFTPLCVLSDALVSLACLLSLPYLRITCDSVCNGYCQSMARTGSTQSPPAYLYVMMFIYMFSLSSKQVKWIRALKILVSRFIVIHESLCFSQSTVIPNPVVCLYIFCCYSAYLSSTSSACSSICFSFSLPALFVRLCVVCCVSSSGNH